MTRDLCFKLWFLITACLSGMITTVDCLGFLCVCVCLFVLLLVFFVRACVRACVCVCVCGFFFVFVLFTVQYFRLFIFLVRIQTKAYNYQRLFLNQ